MGGKALKYLSKERKTRRFEKNEFFKLADVLLPILNEIFTEISMVESYKNKDSFGDMDILVLKTENLNHEYLINILNEKLSPGEIHKNGTVYSFDYNNLQIDLILVEKENWEASKIFYQHGDLGNFMGKLFNSFGGGIENYKFKYGFDGVKVKLMYNTNYKLIYLSKDNKKMFELLGLDFNLFESGFESMEDMFDYVIGSKYFNHKIFQWENLNHLNKSRNKKRPGYSLFLEYIKDHESNSYEFEKSEDYYLNKLSKFFGIDIKNEMDIFRSEVDHLKSVRDKFNGNHVMEKFGINGKELGKYLLKFKEIPDYNNYILSTDLESILELFKKVNKIN